MQLGSLTYNKGLLYIEIYCNKHAMIESVTNLIFLERDDEMWFINMI
mgnify:CR=1 FL=1